MKLFCGYDDREAVGYDVFVSSVLCRATVPVEIHRLDACGLPVGSNQFTVSRFLVPWLCGFKGRAVYADASDMLCAADVAELDALFDDRYAVQLVRHSYKTRHPIKYIGTDMQCPNREYPRKNWASLMLINCEHPAWHTATPEVLTELGRRPAYVLGMDWIPADVIGALPDKWNRLVDEGQPTDDAAILHWTAGIPAFKHYANAPGADLWRAELDHMENA